MIKFSDGLRHLYLPGLKDVSNDLKFGVNEWLSLGKDYFISNNLGGDRFNCGVYDLNDYLKPYAFDINRISCAAMESLNDIQKHPASPKFNGWAITKYYYSAFFSAHSILRLTGNGIMNIENNSVSKVKQIARNYSFTCGNLGTGLYCNHDIGGINVEFIKDPQYNDSHKGIWLKFLHFVNTIQPGIYAHLPQADAQSIIDKLGELKDSLTNWGANTGNWLSMMRNLNNYSQDFGVWFPYKLYSKDFDNILKYKNLCRDNPLSIDLKTFRSKDLLYFVRTCQLINAINFDIQKDLVDRHPTNKSFLLHGIFEYHKQYSKSDPLIKV